MKREGERLGMHIKGGLKGQKGNPLDINDEGVFISKINSHGAVHRDGRLKVGLRILEVNGTSLLGATHQEAVECLRTSPISLNLVVCKGYDKSDLIRMGTDSIRLGSRASETGSELSQSVSSLDKYELENSTVLQNSHADSNYGDVFEEVKEENEEEQKRIAEEQKRAAEEIAKIANEVALFNQEDHQLVLAKEKSTPEKVRILKRDFSHLVVLLKF